MVEKTRNEIARRAEYLPFSPPLIGEEEMEEVMDTLRSGWLSTGPKTRAFEDAFAKHLGAEAGLALNSCTAGLHLALVVGGIGPGDEVITTPFTFAASVNVIEHVGARPVLVDVEEDTLNLDAGRVEAALSGQTRAIIAVHYGGHPVELDTLEDIASARNLLLIEDAAHALPARYRGRTVGSGANPAAFSFYATKNLTTGEGGMLTGAPEFLERARVLHLHGMNREAWTRYGKGGSWSYDVEAPGYKYNMSDIQASLGIHQLAQLSAFQQRRRRIVQIYNQSFADEAAIRIPIERPHVEHAWHLYAIRIDPARLRIDRDRFVEELTRRNIGTSVHFIPIHMHSYYRDRYGYAPDDFPIASAAFERVLSIPLNPGMSPGDARDVAAAVLDVVKRYRR